MADYQNYSAAQNQANQLGIQRQDAQNQAALMYQQGQKYAPSQLQAMGLGNTGLSETSQVGLMNTYSNIVNQANRDYASGINKMYQDLAAANMSNQQNLTEQVNAFRKEEQDKADALAEQLRREERQDKLTAEERKYEKELYAQKLQDQLKEQLRQEQREDAIRAEQKAEAEKQNLSQKEKENLLNRYLTELGSAYDQATLNAVRDRYSQYFASNPEMQAYLNAQQNTLNYANQQNQQNQTATSQGQISDFIANTYDKDLLNKYWELNKGNATEEQKILFDYKMDQFDKQEQETKQAYINSLLQNQYGVNPDDGIKISEITTSSLNLTKSLEGKQKKQEKVLEFIKLHPNYYEGKVIDLDFSYKTQNYVVYNGMLYPTDRKAAVKAQAILDEYNKEDNILKNDK